MQADRQAKAVHLELSREHKAQSRAHVRSPATMMPLGVMTR